MTRQERSICNIWDSLRGEFPHVPDKRLMVRAVERYRKTFNDDITAEDIAAALERRADD